MRRTSKIMYTFECARQSLDVLSRMSTALGNAGVSLFAISTYDTDYILVEDEPLETAITALRCAGISMSDFC